MLEELEEVQEAEIKREEDKIENKTGWMADNGQDVESDAEKELESART